MGLVCCWFMWPFVANPEIERIFQPIYLFFYFLCPATSFNFNILINMDLNISKNGTNRMNIFIGWAYYFWFVFNQVLLF